MDINDFLEKFGIASESINRIKLGHGVVGKISTIAIIAMFTIVLISFKLDLWPIILIFGFLIFFIFIIAIRGILSIADKHPDIAILEGSEFLLYHGRIPLGAKNLPNPPKIVEFQSDSRPTPPVIEPLETIEAEKEKK